MKIKKILFLVMIFRKHRSINVDGAERLIFGALIIRKGRTLTITGVDDSKTFRLEVTGEMRIDGDIRIQRKPREMTVDQLRNLSATSDDSK